MGILDLEEVEKAPDPGFGSATQFVTNFFKKLHYSTHIQAKSSVEGRSKERGSVPFIDVSATFSFLKEKTKAIYRVAAINPEFFSSFF